MADLMYHPISSFMYRTSFLYRAFEKEYYAREFVAGRFRMRRLDQFRDFEDLARVDHSEGFGHYVASDGVNEHFELGNPIYVLCCSAYDVDLQFLRKKMGPCIVKISDPSQLVGDASRSIMAQGGVIFGNAKWRAVEYTKGLKVSVDLDEMDRAELSVVQKPSSFSAEKEHRLFVIAHANASTRTLPKHIDVNVGRILPYAEVLQF